ncbi:glycosyltransferase [Candidatus Microgenomates bacterium]|nr:MAG: glycosyltransferase [Candidatus Microgenomates bacterium]
MQKNSTTFADNWQKFYNKNKYYHKDMHCLVGTLTPKEAKVLHIGCRGGELLAYLNTTKGVGVDSDEHLLTRAKKNSKYKYYYYSEINKIKDKFDYILITHALAEIEDAQKLITSLAKLSHSDTRIIVTHFNFLWKPILDLAEYLGLKIPSEVQPNWFSEGDIDNLFYLSNYDKVKSGRRFLVPVNIPYLSDFVNKYISPLPLVNNMSLVSYSVYRPNAQNSKYSVSIIIPVRNEAGNMKNIFKKIPKFAKTMEIIFVEGHSTDNTFEVVREEIRKYKGSINARLFKQKGKGKADAVRLGFSKARNQLLMILDADLTVAPQELEKFYDAMCSGKGEMVMGSRLVYPMESMAMRSLNILGNKLFSLAFSFILGQKIKDTLCGTKVLTKKSYAAIEANRSYFGDFDPFGDYDLIFGAAKLNMKIVEIPIRYKERVYGTTNISRFTHGALLVKMVMFAAKKLKFT